MKLCVKNSMPHFKHFPGCSAYADILFLIDRSGSIRHERFDEVKEFLVDIIDDLEVWNDKIRVAAISFSDDATLEFDFNDYRTKQDVEEALRTIRYSGGRTNIASALQMAREQAFTVANGDRLQYPVNTSFSSCYKRFVYLKILISTF